MGGRNPRTEIGALVLDERSGSGTVATGSVHRRPLIYDAILIASILFLPDGLESLGPKIRRVFARARNRAGEGAADWEARSPAGTTLKDLPEQ